MTDELIVLSHHIAAEEAAVTPTAKTKKWRIINRRHGISLGIVRWHAHWRQYVFAPEPGTIYNRECMGLIAKFVSDQTELHRKQWSKA